MSIIYITSQQRHHIDDLVEDVALYVVVDAYLEFQRYTSQHIAYH